MTDSVFAGRGNRPSAGDNMLVAFSLLHSNAHRWPLLYVKEKAQVGVARQIADGAEFQTDPLRAP